MPMLPLPLDSEAHPLRPIVSAWLEKIELCDKLRSDWKDVAEECRKFYSGKYGWMWQAGEQTKYLETQEVSLKPLFKMQQNLAFEFVALFGPLLYNRNPIRTASPRKEIDLPVELFVPQMPRPLDQMQQMQQQQMLAPYQQQYDALQMQSRQQEVMNELRAKLMEQWLNYTPNEQPHGGLKNSAERAVTDALLTGRGVLWSEIYTRPDSQLKLTASFHDDPENLFVDPDAERWQDVMWVVRRCTEPRWKLERDYGYPPDYFKGKENGFESVNSQGETSQNPAEHTHKQNGQTSDLITYYKVYSKMGIGSRMTGVDMDLKEKIDQVCGDYCYLVLIKGVPFPINLPTEMLLTATGPDGDQQIAAAVQWPVPYWKDNRWPCSVLDFYTRPKSTLPIAPLEPGLGELKFLNIMMSHLTSRLWMSCRDFIIVSKQLGPKSVSQIKGGGDLCVIECEGEALEVAKQIGFVQQPASREDTWRIMAEVQENFYRRVGLSEVMYGQNPGGTQPRSAEEVAAKRSALQVRPDYMASKAEEWLTEVCRIEAFLTRWHIEPPDTVPLLGQVGSQMWEQYVWNADVESICGEVEYRLENGSARKPDRNRDVANASQAVQLLMNPFMTLAQLGQVGPVNALITQWANSLDLDPGPFMISPPPLPMPPAEEAPPQAA
jgi:hypothetical protein